MNLQDIIVNFQKIGEAMASQRNAILALQKDVQTLKKQVDDLDKEVEHLSSKSSAAEDVEVVSEDDAEYVD